MGRRRVLPSAPAPSSGVSVFCRVAPDIQESALLSCPLSWSWILLHLDSLLCLHHHFLLTLRGHVTSAWPTRWCFHFKGLHRSIGRSSPEPDTLAWFWWRFSWLHPARSRRLSRPIGLFELFHLFHIDKYKNLPDATDFKAAVIFPTWNLTWEELSSPKLKPSWLGHMTWLVPQICTA